MNFVSGGLTSDADFFLDHRKEHRCEYRCQEKVALTS